jgi:hypothetical protein
MRKTLWPLGVLLCGCVSHWVRPGANLAPEGAGFTVVNIETWRGSYRDQLQAHLQRASALGQTPYLEFTAVWCGPCQAIERSYADTAVLRAFRGTYIMRLDIDRWAQVTGPQQSNGIPKFILVDSIGRLTNRRMIGSPTAAPQIAAAFEAFFHPPPRTGG